MTNKQSWTIFWLLFLLYMFDYMDRMVIVSLFPFLKQDMGLTDAQCGLLVSAVYWSILIFSFPAAILVDRWSRTKSISFMAGLWSLATLACAFTRSFPQLLMTRAAIGIGEAGYAPGGTAMLSANFPQEKRARILGLWNASIPLGSALGVGIGGWVAHHFGWRHAFGLVAFPGLVLALVFYFAKDYKTIRLVQKEKTGKEKKMHLVDMARQFTHNKTLLCNNLAFAFAGGTLQYGLLMLVGITAVAFVPSCVAVTQDVVHPGLRAVSLSLNIIIQHLLGSSLAPVVIGRLSDAQGLDKALTILPVFALLSGGLLFMGSFFYHKDLYAANRAKR